MIYDCDLYAFVCAESMHRVTPLYFTRASSPSVVSMVFMCLLNSSCDVKMTSVHVMSVNGFKATIYCVYR